MSYLIFKGNSTANITGVMISKMISHKRARKRYQEFYVRGRDGAVHIDDGYANMTLEATLVLIDATAATRQLVNAWATGSGKLVTSDDLTKAYKASVLDEVKWTRVLGNTGYFDTARILFDCDPYMYEATETDSVYTSSGTITNPGTAVSIPLIKVEGENDVTFTVGGQEITVKSMTSGTPVFLDCENGYVYASNGAMEMIGEFPELPIGESAVTLGTNCTKITISPHWRWI